MIVSSICTSTFTHKYCTPIIANHYGINVTQPELDTGVEIAFERYWTLSLSSIDHAGLHMLMVTLLVYRRIQQQQLLHSCTCVGRLQ